MFNWILIDEIIEKALMEDINYIDITTDNLIECDDVCKGDILAKEDGYIAGLEVFERVFKLLDKETQVNKLVKDGSKVKSGSKIAEIHGKTKAVLKGERLGLNLLQRMSGIATMSNKYAEAVKEYSVRIVDTRKTTPGLRVLEKYAVKVGGCHNHRFNLSEAVMIKDNHIRASGGIEKAILKIRDKIPHTMKIEVEVEDIESLKEAIKAGADIVMLDNMRIEDMKRAVKVAGGRVILEASGGITFDRIIDIAKTGVDIISIGALTHSVKAMDISLKIL